MNTKRDFFISVISILLILLFTYAGITKLIDYEKFKDQLNASPLLKDVSGIVIWFIPAMELYCSLLLVFTAGRMTGLYLSSVLMFLFTTYIGIMLTLFEERPCTCGGVFQAMSWNTHLLFNGVFLILALIGVILGRKSGISDGEIPEKYLSRKSGEAENLG